MRYGLGCVTVIFVWVLVSTLIWEEVCIVWVKDNISRTPVENQDFGHKLSQGFRTQKLILDFPLPLFPPCFIYGKMKSSLKKNPLFILGSLLLPFGIVKTGICLGPKR